MALNLASGSPPWVAIAYVVAFGLVFLGERVFATIAWLDTSLAGIGAAIIVAVTAFRWVAVRSTQGDRRAIERAFALLATAGLLGLAIYWTTTESGEAKLGWAAKPTETRERLETVALVAWVTLVSIATIPTLFGERALFPMRRAAQIEWRRIRNAMGAGLALSLAVVYASLFVYSAGELDIKADYSYFQAARPSESTRKIIENLNEPLKVRAFFPQVNEVGAQVTHYLRDLQSRQPNFQLTELDRLLAPEQAKSDRVNEDGVIVLEKGTQKELIAVGTDLKKVRQKVKNLDADFQKSLLKVLRSKRVAYITVGHGELNENKGSDAAEGRTARRVRELLESQNFTVKDLGASSGLGFEVPSDAELVLVLGPAHEFASEEVATLRRYAEGHGKLFVALDPDAKVDLAPLADMFGLTLSKALLANDKVHMRRRFNDSDHSILATNRFSSHASVSTLSRIGSQPVFLLGAGSLEKKSGAPGNLNIDFALRALPDTFNDENGDFKFDEKLKERRSTYSLAAAVTRAGGDAKSEMRAFVVGDADVISDAPMTAQGNSLFFLDSVRWLAGEESFAGEMASPEDVRIEHTKQKDLLWFYGTIVGAPALVLGVGLLGTRRVRREKRKAS